MSDITLPLIVLVMISVTRPAARVTSSLLRLLKFCFQRGKLAGNEIHLDYRVCYNGLKELFDDTEVADPDLIEVAETIRFDLKAAFLSATSPDLIFSEKYLQELVTVKILPNQLR